MALYRTISLSFWSDPKVDDEFTPEDKYFFLYLLTNPHTNICGCYSISQKQMERETGYSWDTINRLINRMQNVHGVVFYDEKTKEILVQGWGKYNWSRSEKLINAVVKDSGCIKNECFREYVLNAVKHHDFDFRKFCNQKTVQTVSETAPEPVTDTVTDTVSDTVSVSVSVTDVSLGYGYPIDTVLKTNEEEQNEIKNNISVFTQTCVYSWNEITFGTGLSQVTKITGDIQDKISEMIKAGITIDDFKTAANICAASGNLKGDNNIHWKASFVWLITKKDGVFNITKVLNGAYDQASKAQSTVGFMEDADVIDFGGLMA